MLTLLSPVSISACRNPRCTHTVSSVRSRDHHSEFFIVCRSWLISYLYFPQQAKRVAIQLLFTTHGSLEPACLETLWFSSPAFPSIRLVYSVCAADRVPPDWASSICLGMLAFGSIEGCYCVLLMMTTGVDLVQRMQEV